MSILKTNLKFETKNTSNFSLPLSSMGVLTNLLFVKINDKVARELENFKEELRKEYQDKLKNEIENKVKFALSAVKVELKEELKNELIVCVQDGIREELINRLIPKETKTSPSPEAGVLNSPEAGVLNSPEAGVLNSPEAGVLNSPDLIEEDGWLI